VTTAGADSTASLSPTPEGLARLASWEPVLADPNFEFGRWIAPQPLPDGTVQVGWYELSEEALWFVTEASAHGFVLPFDWIAWAESNAGQALLGHADAVATAPASDLVRLLTTYVRGERFADGTLEGAFDSGMLAAIARRAAALAASRG
jgi:hypothetical protein